MDDLIQRQAVLDALRARFGVDFDWGKWWSSTHVLAAIESVPSVTPQEPKVGHWKDIYLDDRNEWIMFFCESCGHQFGLEDRECGWRYGDPIPWKYCPDCGARMVEPEESEDA